MKQQFSKSWKASTQPRKQRKYRFNAPLNIRRKMMASNLSKGLRKKYGRRSFPIRKGDIIKIFRGKFKGKNGTVEFVNYKRYHLIVDGIFIKKKDGTKIPVKIHPSKVQITELNLDDNKRIKSLKKKMEKEKNEIKKNKLINEDKNQK